MRTAYAVWFILLTVVNVLVWKFIPCAWDKPYQVGVR